MKKRKLSFLKYYIYVLYFTWSWIIVILHSTTKLHIIFTEHIKEINQRRHLRKVAKKDWFLKEKLVGIVLIVRN